MQDRLARIRTLIGPTDLEKIRHGKVMVVGCGAVGSFAVEALARSGVGHLALVDFDVVEASNINRQLIALSSTLGIKKVNAAKTRVLDISPEIKVDTFDVFVDEQNVDNLLDWAPDFVIDAIDSLESKVVLIEKLLARKIPFISSMGAARREKTNAVCVSKMNKTHTCPMASAMRQKLRKKDISLDFSCVYSTEEPIALENGVLGSMVTVTGIFGLTLAHEALNFLRKKEK